MNIWDLSKAQWLEIYEKFKSPCPFQDIGDITVVCHTSNQVDRLEEMIPTARSITDKIIIFDDCSRDNTREVAFSHGCRVFDVPEGWIYTHGFGALICKQVEACDTEYHLQIDSGERLWIPPDCPKVNCGYGWVLRLNMSSQRKDRFHQKMFYRLINTSADLVFNAVIHGSPSNSGSVEGGLKETQIAIFHDKVKVKPIKGYYRDRKDRLYWKLLRKGFYEDTLENGFWANHYRTNKKEFDEKIDAVEKRIGVLEETDATIQEVFN